MALYINDCYLLNNDFNLLKKMKEVLSKKYDMINMRDHSSFLNLYITRNRDKKILSLSQAKYIEKKLQQFNLSHAKPMHTALEANCNLLCVKEISQKDEDIMKTVPYKFAVEALMYLAITSRVDICYAISMVAQYNSKLRQNHWSCIKRILRYLNGTTNNGNGSLKVIGFCDTD